MKKTIWKYPIEYTDDLAIEMPIGAEILSIQNHNDRLCIWAFVDPNAATERRWFEVYGTGHEIDFNMNIVRKFIGTCQFNRGALVLHIFERIK